MARCFLWFTVLLLGGCASFAPESSRPDQFSLAPATHGSVAGLAAAATAGAAQDESAFWLLPSAQSALEARTALFDEAVASLDIQYFIWQDDLTSYFLLQRILAAADRGVRVRLLVDDYSASGRDREFYALAQHENVEVRSFNAFRARAKPVQVVEFIFRFGRLNHRMHIKAILADGQIGIVGGRNIGDRYFGVYSKFIQYDLDVMFAGEAVKRTQRSFDDYWNSSNTVVTHSYLRPRQRVDQNLDEFRSFLAESVRGEFVSLAAFSFDSDEWMAEQAQSAALAPAQYVYDSPDIDSPEQRRIKDDLYAWFASAREELVIVTAYLIPDDKLLEVFYDLRARGVRVLVLTNSVQSNNHMLAHVAYKRFRRRLLRAGVELYELRPDASILDSESMPPTQPGYVGLHSKAAVVDGHMSMVGTANLDPRALAINTESAFFFENEELAADIRTLILDSTLPANAWELSLDARGRVQWAHDSEVRSNEPVRGLLQRVLQFLHVFLPLKGQA